MNEKTTVKEHGMYSYQTTSHVYNGNYWVTLFAKRQFSSWCCHFILFQNTRYLIQDTDPSLSESNSNC